MTTYKINEAIKVRFQALGGQTGISDLQLVATNPNGVDGSPITLSELSNGLYEASFTPNLAGRWQVKITSSTYPENGTSESYYVGNQNADYNIIIGSDGNKLKVDSNGRLETIVSSSSSAFPLQLLFNQYHSAVETNQWQEVLAYQVPTDYDLNPLHFSGYSQTTNEHIRAIRKIIAGSFVGSTNTFTDGSDISAPQFFSMMYLYVTSQIGSKDDTITITYTNQAGTTGRTATITATKNSLIGTRLEITLQSGDYGIRDITNITHSETDQTGNFQIELCSCLFYLILTSSSILYDSKVMPTGCITIYENEYIYLQYLAQSKSSYLRRLALCNNLISRI